jgi:protein-S-isoprenylcysteine O-methyltransferase Ste14
MSRIVFLVYGLAAYLIFFLTFCYAVGFVNGIGVPTCLDGPATMPLGKALLIDLGLLALFACQHSIMARPAFKRWWTTVVPEPIERSTFVLFASLCLLLLFWQWQPIGGTIWSVGDPVFRAVVTGISLVGFLIVLVSTFLIDHFDLFGLRQVWCYFLGKPHLPLQFRTPGIYKVIRHPIYLGFMIGFWAAPTMTVAHFVFAIMTTAYMLIAIRFEEHDLIRQFGDTYRRYRARVPMLLPAIFRRSVPVIEDDGLRFVTTMTPVDRGQSRGKKGE